MALKEFYCNLDLNQNQLLQAVLENRNTMPNTGVVGQIFYHTVNQCAYICISTSPLTWQSMTGSVGATEPTGVVKAYLGTSAPTGYLICDGSSVLQASYATLFALIGTMFGGDATHFNLPDLRGKFIKGKAVGDTLGADGGTATHKHNDHVFTPQGTISQPTLTMNQFKPSGSLTGGAVDSHQGTAVNNHGVSLTHSGSAVANHTNVTVPATANGAQRIGASTAAAADNAHTHVISSIPHTVTQPNTHDVTLTHTVTQARDHVFTQPTFNGDIVTLTGTVSAPTFTGTQATLTHDAVSHEPLNINANYIIKT